MRQDESPSSQQPPTRQLTSFAPSIFTPLTTDPTSYTRPPASPRTARHAQTLSRLDEQANGVRDNIRGLARRECLRILLEDRGGDEDDEDDHDHDHDDHDHHVATSHARLPDGELADMIANMEALPAPVVEAIPESDPPDWYQARPPSCPREEMARNITMTTSNALSQLKGFDAHVARVRAPFENELRQIEAEKSAL